MWLIFTINTADNLTFFHCKRFEFTCDVKSFLDKNSNHCLSPFSSCLICVQTTFIFISPWQKCPDDHHVGHISSPPSISTLKTTASFHPHLSPSSSAPAPSEQPSSSGHHPLPSNHLAFGSKFHEMAPLLLSSRQQLQPPKPPPYSSIVLKSQWTQF